MATQRTIVGYLRVSTMKQGVSGLGLDAQRAAIEAYARGVGARIITFHTEIETGKRADRPELAMAVSHARGTNSTLVIAKLDRLARNTRFLLTLVESGVDVAFCDLTSLPAGAVGKFMLTQMAAVAELEAGLISERTKAALLIYKERGGVLGTDNLTDEGRSKGGKKAGAVKREKARNAYAYLIPRINEWRSEGMSFHAIAKRLNDEGHKTKGGADWKYIQVKRVLDRG